MTRYYFNVRNGRDHRDMDGTELPDLNAAKLEAVRLTGKLLFDEPGLLLAVETWDIEVTDGEAVVFALRVGAEAAQG